MSKAVLQATPLRRLEAGSGPGGCAHTSSTSAHQSLHFGFHSALTLGEHPDGPSQSNILHSLCLQGRAFLRKSNCREIPSSSSFPSLGRGVIYLRLDDQMLIGNHSKQPSAFCSSPFLWMNIRVRAGWLPGTRLESEHLTLQSSRVSPLLLEGET